VRSGSSIYIPYYWTMIIALLAVNHATVPWREGPC